MANIIAEPQNKILKKSLFFKKLTNENPNYHWSYQAYKVEEVYQCKCFFIVNVIHQAVEMYGVDANNAPRI